MIDIYTKVILTIIGITLIGLLLQPIIMPKPSIADGIVAVDLVRINGYYVQNPLEVKVVKR